MVGLFGLIPQFFLFSLMRYNKHMPNSELSAVFCYVYYLRSAADGSFYVGYTSDLKERLAKHNKGLNQSTMHGLPWELVSYEAYRDEDDARRRENYLKTTQGRQALRRMLRNYLKSTADLSQQKVYY